MILLKSENESNVVIIIGLGLIGSAILNRILKFPKFEIEELKVDWNKSDFFQIDFVKWISPKLKSSFKKVDLIWSAGKSGFESSKQDCDLENDHFRIFLESVNKVSSKYSFKLTIHLVSSAGGLFEGQLGVNEYSIPNPKRPYGLAKFWQEKFLISKFPISYFIYRPSSVYGPINNGKRLGLISKMVKNLKENKEITILGEMTTLRDFIWVDDVARPIVDNVFGQIMTEKNIIFLVSAKPTSIMEINSLIKKVTNRSILFKFNNKMEFSSMSFSKKVKSNLTINLELGIKVIYCSC